MMAELLLFSRAAARSLPRLFLAAALQRLEHVVDITQRLSLPGGIDHARLNMEAIAKPSAGNAGENRLL
jgi:hypothetical protein